MIKLVFKFDYLWLMKELQKFNLLSEKQSIETIVKKKQEVEYKFDYTIRPRKNHKVFEIYINTLIVTEAEYVKHKFITWEDAIKRMNGGSNSDILLKKNHVYISALNKDSALKRYLLKKGSAKLPKAEMNIKDIYKWKTT